MGVDMGIGQPSGSLAEGARPANLWRAHGAELRRRLRETWSSRSFSRWTSQRRFSDDHGKAGFGRPSLAAFLANPAAALAPAAETGACSLENATPATVAVIENNGELLLDDGRRARLSGVEFPPAGGAAHKRLSQWLAGQDVFIRAFSGAPDRWGRTPAAFFAAQGSDAAAPIVSVGAALLEEGLARFRPDPPAAPCATEYRAAEAIGAGRAARALVRCRNAARRQPGRARARSCNARAWWFWRAR